jgi:hypothetical protein
MQWPARKAAAMDEVSGASSQPAAGDRIFRDHSSSRRHAVSSARASCGIGLRRRWLIEAGACASQDPTRSPRAPALFLRGCPVAPPSLTTTAQQLHRLVFWRSPQEPRSTLSASASCARFPLEHHISPLPSPLCRPRSSSGVHGSRQLSPARRVSSIDHDTPLLLN